MAQTKVSTLVVFVFLLVMNDLICDCIFCYVSACVLQLWCNLTDFTFASVIVL